MAAAKKTATPEAGDASNEGIHPRGADSRRETRTVQAYSMMLDRLMRLTYAPGDSLTESEVAADLGMTKTPVREALLMLSSDQLVIARPGAGYRVLPITMRTIRDLCAHWRLVEGAAVDAACARGVADLDVIQIDEALSATTSDPYRAHTQAHHMLIDLCTSFYLWREWQRLQVEIERLLRFTLPHATRNQLHEGILELFTQVIRGDAAGARAALDTHVTALEQSMIDGLLASDATVPTLFDPRRMAAQ